MYESEINTSIVHTRQINYSLGELQNVVEANDIITDPDYQRNYVYDNKHASLLVESILIGIPIPIIYLAEEDDGVLSVIDGQQRITSFVRYLRNEFQLVGLTKLQSLNGLFFKDLEKSIQRKLRTLTVSAVCIEKGSEDLKYEIFSRLNRGAIKLKDQEVRNCIYRGRFNDMLKDVANNNQILKDLFHDSNTRFVYEERILRFFTLRDYMHLKGTYKTAMNRYMQQHSSDSDEQLVAAKKQFNSTIELVKNVLGDDAFFNVRRKFNGAIYDSIMIPFSYFPKKSIMKHADEVRKEIHLLKTTNKEYQDWVYAGTNAGTKVRCRINAVMSILNKIISSDQPLDSSRTFDPDIKKKLFHPGYKCDYCGNQILSIDDCEIDHIIPYSLGGSTSIENAQLLHKTCNRSKGCQLSESDEFIDDRDDLSED